MQNRKVALVTGAARRIGAEIATILHENDMNIIVHYNNSEVEAKKLCEKLNKKRENSAIALSCDLLKINQFNELVKNAAEKWGRLDVLVNNAARFYRTTLDHVTEEQWEDLITSNLKAPFFLAQAAVPYLKKQKGCIVNLVDIHAERPMGGYPVYSISKAGIAMLTKALAKELGPDIRVNAVSPGPMVWPEEENILTPEEKTMFVERTALKRPGDPKEIAKAVLFLVNHADFVTGHILAVDAGRSLCM